MIRGRLPYSLATHIANPCEVSPTANTQELRDCAEPKDTQDLAATVADLRRDRAVLNSLRTHMSQVRVQRHLLTDLSK